MTINVSLAFITLLLLTVIQQTFSQSLANREAWKLPSDFFYYFWEDRDAGYKADVQIQK